ncbi:MAG: hypothetical protein ABII13_01730 [Patescibacteria group bacterium]|nr:type II toxin-antitoxin system Phd/YefM family antitoxin [Patescibacteria group bacterium]MBU2509484.1 type II toxin-antitoxin system Phd/YefM family antitoxin [Patescibacteria group bacterium]
MSLKHVLRTARRNGLPVIITDDEGREPMVILSLDQFESMSGVESMELEDWDYEMDEPEDIGMEDEFNETPYEFARSADPLIELEKSLVQEPTPLPRVPDFVQESSPSLSDLSDSPMEEGFYLEPLEDK